MQLNPLFVPPPAELVPEEEEAAYQAIVEAALQDTMEESQREEDAR